jgi:preprotein translocase subunit SecG
MTSLLDVMNTVLTVILILSSLLLIIVVLLQPGKSAGLSGAIAGGAETFFGRNKAKSYEGKLALATKIATGVVFAVSLALVIVQKLM